MSHCISVPEFSVASWHDITKTCYLPLTGSLGQATEFWTQFYFLSADIFHLAFRKQPISNAQWTFFLPDFNPRTVIKVSAKSSIFSPWSIRSVTSVETDKSAERLRFYQRGRWDLLLLISFGSFFLLSRNDFSDIEIELCECIVNVMYASAYAFSCVCIYMVIVVGLLIILSFSNMLNI